jgi:hypothetical protein
MPIPEPNKGEREEEYISRCMSEIGGEYDDTTQAVAVCYSTLRDARGQRMSAQELYIFQMNEYRTKLKYRFEDDDPCTAGYTQYGMKEGDGGRLVPNCIPDKKEE